MAGTITASVVKNDTTSPMTFQNSAGTEIGTLCRAWVNFNGADTVAIRASFNVSSITDNGTGGYTVNFTNALPDANYAVFGLSRRGNTDNNSQVYIPLNGTYTSSQCQIFTGATSSAGVQLDSDIVNIAAFR